MSFGIDQEHYVADGLRATGASCHVDTKMRGATDVIAEWPTGTSWRIQVKSTQREGASPAWPTNEEIRRLKISATKNGQTPVVALVYEDGSKEFYYARTWKRAYQPDTRGRR